MNTGKTFRHGQILRLISDASITNQQRVFRKLVSQHLEIANVAEQLDESA